MKKIFRQDKFKIIDFKEDPLTGFLHIDAVPVARTGVFPYLIQDSGGRMYIRKEAKLPEELFADAAMNSLKLKPVTNNHPREFVNTSNNWLHTCGLTHNDATVKDEKFACISMTIQDEHLIEQIKNGEKREISGGFICIIDNTPGVFHGQPYDAIQREIEYNHIAVVEQGRCGPECSIKVDKTDSTPRFDEVGFYYEGTVEEYQNKRSDSAVTIKKVKVGDQEFEVPAVVADELEKVTKERDTIQGRVDSLESANKDLESRTQTTLDEDAVRKIMAARQKLVDDAKSVLGSDYDPGEKTDMEIMTDVIKLVDEEFKADGKSNDYLQARYDGTVHHIKKNGLPQRIDHSGTGSDTSLRSKRKDTSTYD